MLVAEQRLDRPWRALDLGIADARGHGTDSRVDGDQHEQYQQRRRSTPRPSMTPCCASAAGLSVDGVVCSVVIVYSSPKRSTRWEFTPSASSVRATR